MQHGTSLRSFTDRHSAGVELARTLRGYYWHDALVSGLARGGVLVAAAVAAELATPLEVSVVRKIGAPGHPELGIGATTAWHEPNYDADSLGQLGLTSSDLTVSGTTQQAEAQRMLEKYRANRPPQAREGRDVIVVDDGLATGISAATALQAERTMLPRSLTMAVPVGARQAVEGLREIADSVVCLAEPEPFRAVGHWYQHFDQVTDDEVIATLTAADRQQGS